MAYYWTYGVQVVRSTILRDSPRCD
ncbi:hypothetical protein EYZ11_004844 [Aspergillus tanneri]|uniref:Uncharacterized protein n=1 Tax=Aspergillus tanneri TaxID=1220188 RepID=A0A4S3JLT1_9EURO|nr:hypothetical protein EYZ11_004844 [Aspergillus tanneri]